MLLMLVNIVVLNFPSVKVREQTSKSSLHRNKKVNIVSRSILVKYFLETKSFLTFFLHGDYTKVTKLFHLKETTDSQLLCKVWWFFAARSVEAVTRALVKVSKIENYGVTVNGFYPFPVVAKLSIVDVFGRSSYNSDRPKVFCNSVK